MAEFVRTQAEKIGLKGANGRNASRKPKYSAKWCWTELSANKPEGAPDMVMFVTRETDEPIRSVSNSPGQSNHRHFTFVGLSGKDRGDREIVDPVAACGLTAMKERVELLGGKFLRPRRTALR